MTNADYEMLSGTGPLKSARIAIVGAGLSGSLAAIVLARAGHKVTLIDKNSVCPKQFRAEKIEGEQIDLMRKLGVFDAIAREATLFSDILNVRANHIIDRTRAPHFGILYDDIVRIVRAQLPSSVDFIIDEVTDVRTEPEMQEVSLSAHGPVRVDLIVMATGMADSLRHKLGFRRRVVTEKQSISFGFTIAPRTSQNPSYQSLTYYGAGIANKVDYLSLFPVGNQLRANLFTFLAPEDLWIRAFRRNPSAELFNALPGLVSFTGPIELLDKIQNWVMDLSIAENVDQDGVVLIGDAFQTSCPTTGTGVTRLLTDIDRLCNVHIPQWLKTPGMGKDKIKEFYSDPIKHATDSEAMQMAHYRRSLTIDRSLRWSLDRWQHFARRRITGLFKRENAYEAVQIPAHQN